MVLIATAFSQQQTLARLNHESGPDVVRQNVVSHGSLPEAPRRRSEALPESALSRWAANALFVKSDLARARLLAARALRRDGRDAEALFVQMEAAAMQADQAAMLEAALRLCEVGESAKQDVRVQLAAARMRESAANTPEFRALIPRLQAVLAKSANSWPELNAALLRAAMDGVPRLDAESLARASGILTEWRIVGPLGPHSPIELDDTSLSHNSDLALDSYDHHAVENFQFPDGRITLPPYLARHGTFYAASHFASLTAGIWTMKAESAGALEVYVDGRRVFWPAAGSDTPDLRQSETFALAAGPHRVLAKFTAAAGPLQISVAPLDWEPLSPKRAKVPVAELTYEIAAEAYAASDFVTAIKQIQALPSAAHSAALQFLLAQAWTRHDPRTEDGLNAWRNLRALAAHAVVADEALGRWASVAGDFPQAADAARQVLASDSQNSSALQTLSAALAADPDLAEFEGEAAQIWARRLAEHPSCETAQEAMTFYGSREQFAEQAAAQQRLDGCAPGSLAYAQSLAREGQHGEAARALEKLVAVAPLNRSARFMLVGELQLAGDDAGARSAAAGCLRIAPNAPNYRRLAAAYHAGEAVVETTGFYSPYRRDAVAVLQQAAAMPSSAVPILLLDDHVTVARPDGSVSLYVHTTTRFPEGEDIARADRQDIPRDAQLLQLRVVHPDGTATPARVDLQRRQYSLPGLSSGDAIDEEYVVNFVGDGGMSEHPEVFQFVFGRFDERVLSAQFVVLTTAERADRGVVIASSDAPHLVSRVQDTMLARIWQRDEVSVTVRGLALPNRSLPIVRVVEQENGWTVPSDAEHHRRIETIHPGPRYEESSGTAVRVEWMQSSKL